MMNRMKVNRHATTEKIIHFQNYESRAQGDHLVGFPGGGLMLRFDDSFSTSKIDCNF